MSKPFYSILKSSSPIICDLLNQMNYASRLFDLLIIQINRNIYLFDFKNQITLIRLDSIHSGPYNHL